jgi:hypothetical protein
LGGWLHPQQFMRGLASFFSCAKNGMMQYFLAGSHSRNVENRGVYMENLASRKAILRNWN